MPNNSLVELILSRLLVMIVKEIILVFSRYKSIIISDRVVCSVAHSSSFQSALQRSYAQNQQLSDQYRYIDVVLSISVCRAFLDSLFSCVPRSSWTRWSYLELSHLVSYLYNFHPPAIGDHWNTTLKAISLLITGQIFLVAPTHVRLCSLDSLLSHTRIFK